MIELTYSLSTNIIKKGDYFSIYLNIVNGHEVPISLTNVKLFQPTGFIQSPDVKQYSIFDAIKDFFKSSFGSTSIHLDLGVIGIKYSDVKEQKTSKNSVTDTTASISQKFNQIVQPKNAYRVDFNLKAGWSGGLRPRPDTYKISAVVDYNCQGKKLFKQINIEISIFPSLGSMLAGTLVGSLLGSSVNAISPHIQNNKIPLPGLEIIIPQIFANLILGFIVGITLMRKKDVQPFLTVEDFWGGILLGFLVGYSGQQFLKQFIQ
jgi:hypothetical protein